MFPVVNLSYILLRVKALLDWLHSYQQSAHDCRICNRPVPASTRKLFPSSFHKTNLKVNLIITITINYGKSTTDYFVP